MQESICWKALRKLDLFPPRRYRQRRQNSLGVLKRPRDTEACRLQLRRLGNVLRSFPGRIKLLAMRISTPFTLSPRSSRATSPRILGHRLHMPSLATDTRACLKLMGPHRLAMNGQADFHKGLNMAMLLEELTLGTKDLPWRQRICLVKDKV